MSKVGMRGNDELKGRGAAPCCRDEGEDVSEGVWI